MPTILTLTDRLARHKAGQKDPKDPAYWPFCICCHLAAPESKSPPVRTSYTDGPEPDLSAWGMVTTPTKTGSKEQHHLCPDCLAFQITQLVRYHKAQKSKIEQIARSLQMKEKCGLRLAGHLNPFQSAFCCKPKGHTDKCE